MPHSSTTLPFDQAWTLEDTRAELVSHASYPENGSLEEKTLWAERSRKGGERLAAALLGHLTLLAQEGRLSLPPHTEAVETRWLDAWRLLLKGKPTRAAIDPLRTTLLFNICTPYKKRGSEEHETPEEVHARLVQWVKDGNVRWFQTGERAQCRNSGERLCLKFEGWGPVVGLPQHGNTELPVRPLAAGDIAPPDLVHVTVEVPSGELWITDWICLDAFKTAVQQEVSYDRPTVNTLAGRVAETRRCQELGFVFFCVNNTSPSVVLQDGRLVVGLEQMEGDDEVQGKKLGRICTDMWWTTIIDRQVLSGLMATQVGQEAAETALVEYEKRDPHDLIKINVPPGTYHLYFAGNPDVFHDRFSSPQVATKGFEEVMGVLSPDELTLVPKSRPARRSTRARRP